MNKKMSQFVEQLFQGVGGSVGPRFSHVDPVNLCLEIALQKCGLLGMLCSSATLGATLATLGAMLGSNRGWHTAGLWKTVVGT